MLKSVIRLLASFAVGSLLMSAAAAQTAIMRIASPTVNTLTEEWMKAFKSGVESRSAGRIKVELYPSGQLGSIPATVEGVALGTIEVSAPATGFLAGLEPRFLVFDTPGLFDDFAHAQRTLADPEILKLVATFGAEKGLEPLAILVHGPTMTLSHKPIRTIADFKGQKLRVPGGGPLYVEPVKQLGASPVSMPLGEVLPALQNRTIDGFFAASAIFTAMKFYDVAKTLTENPGTAISAVPLANKKFLSSLSPDLQAIVREEASKAAASLTPWAVENNGRALNTWRANGGEVVSLSSADAQQYRNLVATMLPKYLAANPVFRADYEAFVEAAKKHR